MLGSYPSYEEDEEEKNLNAIIAKFKSFNDGQDLGNTEQYLIDVFNQDSNACLICIESIGNKEAIWSCSGCYCQFHIVCIQNWIKDGSYLSIKSNFDSDIKTEIPWNCPKCRKEYNQKDYPSTYFCYCKKVKNPEFDPWSVPHSCSQKCNKLKPCNHNCLMLCHPGPCPPCPKMVQNSCYCSKSSAVSRRCSNKYWSCNKVCNKLLPCKQHICENICHPGDCGECLKMSLQFCKCKKSRKEVPCTQTTWSCDQKCLKPYSCGFHQCQLVCHENGKCGECPRSLIRTCPCGKTASQKSCTEEIPTCGDTCDKNLTCNTHKCAQRCHFGSCDICRQVVIKKCRCGQKEKELACNVEFTCELKCNKMRNCGKHKCNKKCCDGNCPPCEQVCNKLLACKIHKCKSLCHSGFCYPCPIVEEIKCPCGSSKVRVACSSKSKNIKVPCKNLCNMPSKCHHERIQNHKCHYGDCPACKIKCGLKLKCGHLCSSNCHDHVLTEIIENKDREGPWVPLNVKKVHVKQDCGDCMEPIKTTCLGGHETSNLPCHRAKPYNCGSKCGILLKCTNHKCELECHSNTTQCEECEKECEKPKPDGCTHSCSLGHCHTGPCPKCKILIKMKCNCKNNFVHVECNKWNSSNQSEQNGFKSCRVPCVKTIPCGHQCSFVCHPESCSSENDCQEKVVIKCACKTLRKSLLCNQIRNESDLKEVKKQTELKYQLRCNERCIKKLNKLEEAKNIDNNKNDNEKAKCGVNINKQQYSNLIYFIYGFLVLFISIMLYFYFLY